jgi:hypothetical protein
MICLLLCLVAVLFAVVGTSMPLHLSAQAADDRAYYNQFKFAAAYTVRNGRPPAGQVLRELQSATTGPSIWASLTTTPLDCDPSFKEAPADRFVLSFWRGEWSECYAYPSGRTTLPMSVRAYLLSGLGVDLAMHWLVAISAAWGAVRFRPRRRASGAPSANGS